MSDLFWLSTAQMRRIGIFLYRTGLLRVDDRKVISGIIFVDQERPALARCAQGLRPAQDDLQSLHPLEPAWGVQRDLRVALGGPGRCKPMIS